MAFWACLLVTGTSVDFCLLMSYFVVRFSLWANVADVWLQVREILQEEEDLSEIVQLVGKVNTSDINTLLNNIYNEYVADWVMTPFYHFCIFIIRSLLGEEDIVVIPPTHWSTISEHAFPLALSVHGTVCHRLSYHRCHCHLLKDRQDKFSGTFSKICAKRLPVFIISFLPLASLLQFLGYVLAHHFLAQPHEQKSLDHL